MREAAGDPQTAAAAGTIRFGSFEVDTRSGELRRKGIKVKLSAQPFDVLVALVEKPGQVVTREELREKLWTRDTFIDFEHGLNKAINKVREALGDNADNPRFIETLPRRGYRFLAPVTAPAQPEAQVADGTAPAAAAPAADRLSGSPTAPTPERRKRRRLWPLAIGTLGVLSAAVMFLSLPGRQPRVLRVTQLTHDGLRKAQDSLTFLPATDGSRVYFSEDASGTSTVIAQVSVTGSPVSTLATLPNHLGQFNSGVLALDYSPTRSELLVYGRSLSPLYSLSLPVGSAPRRIGDYSVNGAAWAPDGQSILISSRDTLYRVKADGSELRKLATLPGYPMYPRWSPDGKKIVFSINPWNDLPSPLWEIDADGANPRPLLAGRENETDLYPAWSPNGKYLIYALNDVQLFAVQRKGGLWHRQATPVQLTSGPLSFTAPTFAPDGKTIYALGFLNQGELMHYDRGTQQWKPYLSGISAADADFSHDGERVTYVLVPEGTLWRSRVDGSERTQLTIAPFRVILPRWSPDGKQIAFMGLQPGGRWTIYLIAADGGQAERLVKDNKFYADPNWSPDGKRIVYGEQALNPKAIHIFDLQSRQISDLPDSAGLYSPRWSPDGRYIIAETAADLSAQNGGQSSTSQELMIFDLNGQKWRRWCESPLFNYPVFSRDGKYVYFSDPDASMFYRLRFGENKIEPVAKIDVPGGLKQDDFWYWTGLTPDDSPLVMRDAGTQEIYALDVDLP